MADETKTLVLVADDEPSTRALVVGHLKRRGYRVIEASDGDETDMQPQALDLHCPQGPVRYALEVKQDGFRSKGIQPGMRITGEPFGTPHGAIP